MAKFLKGQRWISESEPELGVGVVVDTAPDRVFLLFRVSNTTRQYATGSAPIKRVEFQTGDTIKLHNNQSVVVEAVENRDGLLSYLSAGQEYPETELSDTLSFSKPEDRLFIGQVDAFSTFSLRQESLQRRHQIRHSPVRGLLGARITLIPHQLFIAHEVAGRALPRVLLADEVGLGKTIEACLILHRLHRSGRVGRILILVPEPLIHQWFVELLRRFNLLVSIFDEDRCRAIEAGEAGSNPFLDDQVVLCPLGFVAGNPTRGQQVVEAGWDLVVIDEAHHLTWSPESPSPEYQIAESLAADTPGLILLTATPEQLGAEGHFARLRLLDPDRYADFEGFRSQRSDYQRTAKITAKLLDGKTLTGPDLSVLRRICSANPERLEASLAALKTSDGKAEATSTLVQELLDQHGPGRVMFRNTRAAMKGFPKRRAQVEILAAADLSAEWRADEESGPRSYCLDADPRLEWLVRFLGKMREAKVLLICRTREKVLALDQALRDRVNLKIALFHEELSLLQRDRNAAWFAESDGAQILLCSEIGSEGRNFQFAHHLVLFDLPALPGLLEQRIGRLDRIGQTETIFVHVPCPAGSQMETLASWYQEGLNAFEHSLEGEREILARFGERLHRLLEGNGDPAALRRLIADTKKFHTALAKELKDGEDRLLQMNSCRPEAAANLISQIKSFDADPALDAFMLRVFDHFGVHVEDLADRTYLAVPAELTTDAFPELPPEGLTLTTDRSKALSREEIGFLTWDHPIATSAIDLLLGSEQGNSSFAIWPGGPDTPQSIYLETLHVLEPVAPAALHADRFLAPTPIRIVVDPKGLEVSEEIRPPDNELKEGSVFQLLDNSRIKHKLLPAMLEKARQIAAEQAATLIQEARSNMNKMMGQELERLRDLRKVNDHIREDEIALQESQIKALSAHLQEAPLRLDAVRLIWRTP